MHVQVLEIWKSRVKPLEYIEKHDKEHRAENQEEAKNLAQQIGGGGGAIGGFVGATKAAGAVKIDPFEDAETSKFRGLNVAENTAILWGRRVHHVAISENCIFALCESGEVYSWGGNNFWWHEIQPDSIYQSKWRGDVTPRSQLLLGKEKLELPLDAVQVDANDELSADDLKAEYIKIVTKYFNCWEPPPSAIGRYFIANSYWSYFSY
jgi:hypothetical protein